MPENQKPISISLLIGIINVILIIAVALMVYNMTKAGENFVAVLIMIPLIFILTLIGLVIGIRENEKVGRSLGKFIHILILGCFLSVIWLYLENI